MKAIEVTKVLLLAVIAWRSLEIKTKKEEVFYDFEKKVYENKINYIRDSATIANANDSQLDRRHH